MPALRLSMTPLYFRTDVNSLVLDLNILCDMQQTGILMGVLNIGHDTLFAIPIWHLSITLSDRYT
jgi:hypothetical protein